MKARSMIDLQQQTATPHQTISQSKETHDQHGNVAGYDCLPDRYRLIQLAGGALGALGR